jgi:hypothetical protein
MQSPSFESRRKALAAIFRVGTLRRTWREKVRFALRDRVLPDPIDYLDFHTRLSRNIDNLVELVVGGNYQPRTPARILMEKTKGLCRQIVLPSAQDALVLQRLSDTLFSAIRGHSPSKSAYFEPDNFTFGGDGRRSRGYGSLAAWLHFQNKLKIITNSSRYMVVSDIANYYDYIGYSALRNILSGTISTPESTLDILLRVLSAMNWSPDYLPNSEMGLPQIDLDAPRVLAHSFLFDLDRYAELRAPGQYTRYMDDINFGTNSIAESKNIIRDVDLILHTRQVRLNSGKTVILSSGEASKYFRFQDHAYIDAQQLILELTPKGSAPHEAAAEAIQKELLRGYRRGDFDHGHGDKVLKRLVSLCRIYERSIPARILADILRRRPTCRESVLGYLASRPARAVSVSLLADFATSPETIDDVGPLMAATTLVNMQAKTKTSISAACVDVASVFRRGGPHRLYAAFWLLSKYGTERDLLDLILSSRDQWASSYELGRLVGGLFPRFHGNALFDRYRSIIQTSASQSAGSTFQFHAQLVSKPEAANSIHRFVFAINGSRPNGLTHQKYLIMLSVLKSDHATSDYKKQLVQTHSRAWNDAFYREQVASVLPRRLRRSLHA